MSETFRFNRMELAGSLGDLGTLLPIAIAMVLINGISLASNLAAGFIAGMIVAQILKWEKLTV